MYSSLLQIFERFDVFVDSRHKQFSIDRFTIGFYEGREIVEDELIPEMLRLSLNQAFRADVFSIYIGILNEERRGLEAGLAGHSEDRAANLYYEFSMEVLLPKLAVTDFSAMVDFMKAEFVNYPGYLEIYDNIHTNFHSGSGADFITKTYPWYRIGFMLYWRWKSQKQRTGYIDQDVSGQVAVEYAKIGIDLPSVDQQFLKYRLLSLNADLKLSNDKDSQTLYDDRIQKHFWLNVPRRLLFALEDLREQGLYSQIAFNIKAVTEMVPIMEEMERGAKLRINVAELPKISRFYSSESFGDGLWIVHDKAMSSLTFEEHLADFQVDGDNVVTQVVHLEYKTIDERMCITHLDHEFIVYSFEEYMARLDNASEKGSIGKVKSFKIDGAKIPFDQKHEADWFLLIVLDAYFLNHELIQEIFEELGSDSGVL